jgi:N6-adenosine-specific RNA methylase IME4
MYPEHPNLEAHPLATVFPLMEGDAFAELVADIREHGLREPIWLLGGKILDGRNRHRACVEAGIEPEFCEYLGDDPLSFVVSLNLRRRHLNESQRAMVAAELESLSHGGDRRSLQDANLHLARGALAETLKVSPRTVASAAVVRDHGAPELVAAVKRGEARVSAAAAVATLPKEQQTEIVARGEKEILAKAKDIRAERAAERRGERMQKLKAISANDTEIEAGLGRYPIIYADPPWQYDHLISVSREIEEQYPTLPIDQICALPVSTIATDDAMLFLWVPPSFLHKGVRVIEAWGFTYLTQMVWNKEVIGMGYYARQQHENVLIAARGKAIVPAPSSLSPSVISARRGTHSVKPEQFYRVIEGMYPGLPKIELFARAPRAGWAAWGNQAGAASPQAAANDEDEAA